MPLSKKEEELLLKIYTQTKFKCFVYDHLILKRLEKKGFIARIKSDKDKRLKKIKLTQSGICIASIFFDIATSSVHKYPIIDIYFPDDFKINEIIIKKTKDKRIILTGNKDHEGTNEI